MATVRHLGFYPKALQCCYVQSINDIAGHLPFSATFEEVLSFYWKVKKWRIYASGQVTVGDASPITTTWDYFTTSVAPASEKHLVCGQNILGWQMLDGSLNTNDDSLWVTAPQAELSSIPFFGANAATYSSTYNRGLFWEIVGSTVLTTDAGSKVWECYGYRGDSFVYVDFANIEITALEYWNYAED